MTKKQNADHFVWIDLEMTGLDVEKERIIEIAAIVTDSDLNIIEEGPNLAIHQPAKILKQMDAWNQKHHGQSGLIDAVKASKISTKKAEALILKFVKKYCLPKKSPLCGNSIDHDRRFLMKYMPKLADYFHYRNIDVSTIKTLVKRWYPKNKDLPKKQESHRSLTDIRESIEELIFYRKTYFK